MVFRGCHENLTWAEPRIQVSCIRLCIVGSLSGRSSAHYFYLQGGTSTPWTLILASTLLTGPGEVGQLGLTGTVGQEHWACPELSPCWGLDSPPVPQCLCLVRGQNLSLPALQSCRILLPTSGVQQPNLGQIYKHPQWVIRGQVCLRVRVLSGSRGCYLALVVYGTFGCQAFRWLGAKVGRKTTVFSGFSLIWITFLLKISF